MNAMLASSHRFAHALIALEAGIPQLQMAAPPVQFSAFAKAVEKTLELLSAKVRGQRVSEREFPDLRDAYFKFTRSGDSQLEPYAFVSVEADRMTNSLNTLREQIFDWRRDLTAAGGQEVND